MREKVLCKQVFDANIKRRPFLQLNPSQKSKCFPLLDIYSRTADSNTKRHTFIDQGDVHITLPPPRAGLPRLAHLDNRLNTIPSSSATAWRALPLLTWL